VKKGRECSRHGEPQKYIVDTKCYRNSLRISRAWKRDEDFVAKWLAWTHCLLVRPRPPNRRYCGSIRPQQPRLYAEGRV
jgi:hypothetical protein